MPNRVIRRSVFRSDRVPADRSIDPWRPRSSVGVAVLFRTVSEPLHLPVSSLLLTLVTGSFRRWSTKSHELEPAVSACARPENLVLVRSGVSLLASKTDVYVAVVATIGVLIGLIAAYFSFAGWKEQRRQPHLSLGVRNASLRSYENQNAPVRDLQREFELSNGGDAPAAAWKLKLRPPAGSIRNIWGSDERGYHEQEWYLDNLLQRILEWSATTDAEVIPPGDHQIIPCRAQLPEHDELVCHYTLTADRMKARQGSLTIRHSENQPMVEIA